jgi:hypothetical protein
LAGGQHTNPTIADSSWGSTWHFKFQPGLEEPEAGLLGEGKQFKRISSLLSDRNTSPSKKIKKIQKFSTIQK